MNAQCMPGKFCVESQQHVVGRECHDDVFVGQRIKMLDAQQQ